MYPHGDEEGKCGTDMISSVEVGFPYWNMGKIEPRPVCWVRCVS